MEDVIFKYQVWSFRNISPTVLGFSLVTFSCAVMRIDIKDGGQLEFWQLNVLWWFGHTVAILLDSALLISGIFETHWPVFLIWFFFQPLHFLSFIIVWENVLSYIIIWFGNDQQNLRNHQDSLQMFALLFLIQIPISRAARCGALSAEASACQGPWAWRWTVIRSTIF